MMIIFYFFLTLQIHTDDPRSELLEQLKTAAIDHSDPGLRLFADSVPLTAADVEAAERCVDVAYFWK